VWWPIPFVAPPLSLDMDSLACVVSDFLFVSSYNNLVLSVMTEPALGPLLN